MPQEMRNLVIENADELVEALDNVTASLENVLLEFGARMSLSDRNGRQKVLTEAHKVLNAVRGRHQLSGEEQSMLEDLRDRGFAVCVFNPKEIREADPRRVEERMCEVGWDVIGGPRE